MCQLDCHTTVLWHDVLYARYLVLRHSLSVTVELFKHLIISQCLFNLKPTFFCILLFSKITFADIKKQIKQKKIK